MSVCGCDEAVSLKRFVITGGPKKLNSLFL